MVDKLRKAMGNKNACYTLKGMIAFDEGYFTVETSEIEQEKALVVVVQWVKKPLLLWQNRRFWKMYKVLKNNTVSLC